MTRYMPILKGKPAELSGLGTTNTSTRAGVLPMLEVLPPVDDTNPAHIETVCRDVIEKLASGWGTTDAIAVEPLYLPPALVLPSGGVPLQLLMDDARINAVIAIPTVHLSDPPDAISAASAAHGLDGRGVVLRLQAEDMQEDPADLDIWINDLVIDLSLPLSEVDLVIDLGEVSAGQSAALASTVARVMVTALACIGNVRSVTVASGAFPETLDAVAASSSALLPRSDAQLWRTLVARNLKRPIDYGDYSIQHPSLPANAGFGPAPQIRYALADSWRIHKGKKQDRRGYAQFYDHCEKLVSAGEASPATLSSGDDYVHRAAAAASLPVGTPGMIGTGNATTWRQVGTSHHIALVTDRLATVGVP